MPEIDFSFVGYLAGVFGLIAVLTSAFVVYRSTITKTTISEQKGLIDTLTQSREEANKKIATLETTVLQSSKDISGLQGQVTVLSTIPLSNIDASLKATVQELKNLNHKADRNHKAITTMSVRTQTVENQTIN